MRAPPERFCALLAACSAACLTYISLVPFRFQPASFADVVSALRSSFAASIGSRANFLANIVLALPLGFFSAGAWLRAIGWRRIVGVVILLASGTVFSLSVEILQALAPTRTPSLSDVLAQQIGILVGWATWMMIGPEVIGSFRPAAEHQGSAVERLLLAYTICCVLILLLPLDVTVSRSLLAEKYRQGRIVLAPFHAGTAADARVLRASVSSVIFWAPIGIFAVIAWMPRGRRRTLVRAVFAAMALVAAVEMAQVLVLSRVADTTDALSGAVGVLLGAAVMIRFSGRTPSEPCLRGNRGPSPRY